MDARWGEGSCEGEAILGGFGKFRDGAKGRLEESGDGSFPALGLANSQWAS